MAFCQIPCVFSELDVCMRLPAGMRTRAAVAGIAAAQVRARRTSVESKGRVAEKRRRKARWPRGWLGTESNGAKTAPRTKRTCGTCIESSSPTHHDASHACKGLLKYERHKLAAWVHSYDGGHSPSPHWHQPTLQQDTQKAYAPLPTRCAPLNNK